MSKFLDRMLRNGARPFISSVTRKIKPGVGNFAEPIGLMNTPGPFRTEEYSGGESVEAVGERMPETNQVSAEQPERGTSSTKTVGEKINSQIPVVAEVNRLDEKIIDGIGSMTRTDETEQIAQPLVKGVSRTELTNSNALQKEGFVHGSHEDGKKITNPDQKERRNPLDIMHPGPESAHFAIPQSDDRGNEQGNFFSDEWIDEERPFPVGTETAQRNNFEVPQSMSGIPDARTKEKRVPVFVDSEPTNVSIGRQLENRQSTAKPESRSVARKPGEERLLKPDHEKAAIETDAGPAREREAGRGETIAQAGRSRRTPEAIDGQRKMTINRIDIQIINRESPQPVQKIEAPSPGKRSAEIHELLDRRHVRHSLMDY